MIGQILPNIPRGYTALAEILACLTLIWPLPKKKYWPFKIAAFGLGQYVLQVLVGTWSLTFWVPGMALNVLWMYLTIYSISDISHKHASYLCSKAFIIAEFTASFAWQMYCHFLWDPKQTQPLVAFIVNVLFYLTVLTFVFFFEKRTRKTALNVTYENRNVLIAILTAVIIFAMSNIGFALSATAYSLGDTLTIFLFRTLVNLCGICILYMQENQQHEIQLHNELKAVNNIFQNHYEQYIAYKESGSFIEQKFHDLKHQIDVISAEQNAEKKEAYLAEMRQAMNTFSSNIHTGNAILDTILTRKNTFCIENNIRFTCIVDGELLNEMDTMDICSLFGNALDNAIEAVLQIEDHDQRLINLRVFKRGDLNMIHVENYAVATVELAQGLPETTKSDKDYHGYGLKSISYITEKYDGNMNVSMKDNWFSLKVLLPH